MARKQPSFIPGLKKAIGEYEKARPAEPILPKGARLVPPRTMPTIPMPNYPRFPKIQPRPRRPIPGRPLPRRPAPRPMPRPLPRRPGPEKRKPFRPGRKILL
jgi:hypothetical protein